MGSKSEPFMVLAKEYSTPLKNLPQLVTGLLQLLTLLLVRSQADGFVELFHGLDN